MLKRRLYIGLISLILLVLFLIPNKAIADDVLEDEEAQDTSVPFTESCVITAYYSPLPDQSWYKTGSYDGDIRLNGNGTNGASGVAVYIGMIAAPSTIPFGTIVNIDGWGVGSVQDRGGAINGNRLDIWMGVGEGGLARALNWGKRTTTCTFFFPGVSLTSEVEALEGNFQMPSNDPPPYPIVKPPSENNEVVKSEIVTLREGSSGTLVSELQGYLNELGYYDYPEITGYYGEKTKEAVFNFQVDYELIRDWDDNGAGEYGPVTKTKLLKVINGTEGEENVPTIYFESGNKGESIKELQEKLKDAGFYDYPEITGYYGEVTVEAVYNFQVAKGIVRSWVDEGAGKVGPVTLKKLDQYVGDYLYLGEHIVSITRTELSPSIQFTQDLDFGATGDEVTALQNKLAELGYDSPGFYGLVTKNAVCEFQIEHGIIYTCDDPGAGVVGPKTREILNKL